MNMTVARPVTHPLSTIATRRCRAAHPGKFDKSRWNACDTCWEQSIRDDERVVITFDLPRELEEDTDLIDDIAVERACRGEQVTLTPTERMVAVRSLLKRGYTPTLIRTRLRINVSAYRSVLDSLEASKAIETSPELRSVA